MANASDTFTEAADTDLAVHTSDSGHTWTKYFGNVLTVLAASDYLYNAAPTNSSRYKSSVTPASAEYDVQADIRADINWSFGVSGRIDDAVSDEYFAAYENSLWKLWKIDAGVVTTLATYTGDSPNGTTRTAKLEIRNATKKLFIDGVERISSTDNAVTAAGKPGLYGDGNSTGNWMDNWSSTDFVASGTSYTRLVTDGLLMLDPESRAIGKQASESLPLQDTRASTLDYLARNEFMLGDAVRRALDRITSDTVLVGDVTRKAVERLLTDLFLLGDSATAERVLDAFLRSASDGVLFEDYATRLGEMRQRDGLSLVDNRRSDLGLSFLERVVLADLVTRIGELTFEDDVLLREAARKMLEKSISDGALLNDSADTLLTTALVAVLIYALVRAFDPLGVELGHASLVISAVGEADLLSVVAAHNMEAA